MLSHSISKSCSIPDCPNPFYGRSYCQRHYQSARNHGTLPPITHPSVEDRFWSKVEKNGPLWNGSPCWLWTAYCDKDGYGHWTPTHGAAGKRAHRVAYEILIGPIPEGLPLDHLCRNSPCCNPNHLEPVTDRTNILRGVGFAALNAKKTHCPKGHPYSLTNTYINSKGQRICRTCERTRSLLYYYERGRERRHQKKASHS